MATFFYPTLPTLPLNIIFRLNGALQRYCLEMHQLLDEKLLDSFTKKEGPFIELTCFPRYTFLSFFYESK